MINYKKYSILTLLLLAACSTHPETQQEQEQERVENITPPSTAKPVYLKDAGAYDAGFKDPDACVQAQIILGIDPIPKRIDPNCPPIFIDYRWIPPWDPSPIIKDEVFAAPLAR
jgi:hypothetical protein